MKPSEKSKGMEDQIDILSFELFGRSRTHSIKNNVCVSCGKPAMKFKDKLSEKEFSISGLCQTCQSSIWGD